MTEARGEGLGEGRGDALGDGWGEGLGEGFGGVLYLDCEGFKGVASLGVVFVTEGLTWVLSLGYGLPVVALTLNTIPKLPSTLTAG